MVICPNCGTENPERAKFCLECATALDAGPARPSGSRRTVTILFADVVGSTSLGEQLDPEALRGLLARYFEQARTIVERHGGTIEKFIGDAIMAVFGIPTVHEDDALRAVRAAVELRDAIGELNEELGRDRGVRVEFRIGVNTGPVVAGSRDAGSALVTGDAVNVAARLEQSAPAGAILIGQPTFQLVRDQVHSEPAEPIVAKGKSQPVVAHLVLGLAVGMSPRRSETGFVGRQRELARLGQAFEDSRIERRCHLFTLLGAAGVGKSRLINEFVESVSDAALVLRGRCLSYGEGITYWPIGEIVREAAGIAESDDASAARERISASLGPVSDSERIVELVSAAIGLIQTSAPRDELSWGIRRYLEELAKPRGLVCIVEDIHWAEPTLLDLIEFMADWTRDSAILLICTARPELLEIRPTWGGGKVNSTTLSLEPLPAEATEALVGTLVENRDVPPAILRRILDAAEGNPLFAEEIIRMLSDDGVFERHDEPGIGGDMGDVRIPTSVQAVIAARLDRLPAAERSIAEHAAVAGRVFERGAVMALVAEDERPDVARHLMALMRKELVHPDRAELTADDAFRFRHLLIRDTAYEALPKQQRAELHERFAKWVEGAAGDRIAEYGEIVAYHYDQAQRYRRELGLDDSHSAQLAELAGDGLASAGKRAYNRGDMAAAAKLLTRAIDLMSPGPERRQLSITLAVVRNMTRQFAFNLSALEVLRAEADAAGDISVSLKARLLAHSARFWSDPDADGLDSAAREILDIAVPVFERSGDAEGLSTACFIEGDIYLGQAQWQKTKAIHERGAAYAANVDPIHELEHRRQIINAALWGPTPVPEYLALVDDRLRQVHSEYARATVLGERALGLAMMGDSDGARRDTAEARVGRERQLGPNAGTVFTGGFVEYVLGDLQAAERALARTDDQLAALSETGSRSTVVGYLGVVRAELGYPPEEVRRVAEVSRSLTTPEDAASNALWRLGLAWAAAMEGDRAEARRLIEEAEEVGATTDFLWLQGFIQRQAGLIAERDGDRPEAMTRHGRALAIFEEKGDVVDAERARNDIQRLSSLPA